MPATVYGAPDGLDAPEFDAFLRKGEGFDSAGYFAACDAHREAVAEWCRANTDSTDPVVGKTIAFGVADGRAEYMVYRTKPLSLIHLDYVDGYHADPILLRGLRVADVRQLAQQRETLASIFGSANDRRATTGPGDSTE